MSNQGNKASKQQTKNSKPSDEQMAQMDGDNKYLVVTNKRLRALKKKLRHIEELKASGKEMNEQEKQILLTESGIQACIAEVEKLRVQLLEAAFQADAVGEKVAVSEPVKGVAHDVSHEEHNHEVVRSSPIVHEPDYVIIETHNISIKGPVEAVIAAQSVLESKQEEKVVVVEPSFDWQGQMRHLLRLIHLGRLFDANLDRASAAQRQAVLECFNGTVSENDLDSIQLLKQLIDGSAVQFQTDQLPNEIFEVSAEHTLAYLNAKTTDVTPNVSYQRISEIVENLAPYFVVVTEDTETNEHEPVVSENKEKHEKGNRSSAQKRGRARRSRGKNSIESTQGDAGTVATAASMHVAETVAAPVAPEVVVPSQTAHAAPSQPEQTDLPPTVGNSKVNADHKNERKSRGRGGHRGRGSHGSHPHQNRSPPKQQSNPAPAPSNPPVRNYASLASALAR